MPRSHMARAEAMKRASVAWVRLHPLTLLPRRSCRPPDGAGTTARGRDTSLWAARRRDRSWRDRPCAGEVARGQRRIEGARGARRRAPRKCADVTAAGRLTYVGHATVLVELDEVRILTDPVLRARIAHIRRHAPMPPLDRLMPLDAVLISHAHADHLDLPSLRMVSGGATVVAPRGCESLLRRAGARRIVELEEGERCRMGAVTVEAFRADHDGRRHPLARRTAALGYLLSGATRVYFAGDTDLFAGMSELAGRVDVACLPVAGWGPRLPAGHLDPWGAARAAAPAPSNGLSCPSPPRSCSLARACRWAPTGPARPGEWTRARHTCRRHC